MLTAIETFLGHPAVAIILGLLFGALLLLLSRHSVKFLTPESSAAGFAIVAGSLLLRLALAASALLAYRFLLPDGFLWFAGGLAAGFVVMYTLELLKYARVRTRVR